MPPVTKAGGSAFRKDVAFVTKDDDEQRAVGIVMVPDKADLQHDFAREETIREFADQFGNFVEAGEGSGGVMHAAWPSEWMTLQRNDVLDEATDIGGTTAPEGAWVQEWEFNDDDLWSLVDDGILEGYSIGAVNVDWNGPYEPGDDAVDDVAIPDALDDEAMVWELTDGLVREVSAVDIPAVPDAEILETKSEAQKRLAEHLGNRDDFIEEAMGRGHAESEAERLWEVLSDAIDIEGAGEPGKQSMFAKAGRAFLSALSGSDDDGGSEAPDKTAEATAKEGRTLSTANRERLYATIDASLDVLRDAGEEDLPKRFTDRDDVAFDLTEHQARSWGGDEDEDDGEDEDDKHAPEGDTSDDTTDMSDSTDEDGGEDKSLAEKNAEQINELTEAVEGLTKAVTDDGDEGGAEKETATIEVDGEEYEVSKSEVESWFDEDDSGSEKDAEALAEEVKALEERIDTIVRQSGGSQQLDPASGEGEDNKQSGLDAIGGALS
jgi:hypothetical protein